MYNILNSISFVDLYTELATVIRLAVVVVFFFLIWHPDVYNCHNNNALGLKTWVENREMPRRQQSMSQYRVTQFNIIVDVLGGYSRDVRKALKELVGDKSDTIALQIQKSLITSSLNIARRFKLLK